MGSNRGRGSMYCAGFEEGGANTRSAFSVVLRCLQGHTIQGVVAMVRIGGGDTRVFTSISPFIHWICGTVQPDPFEPSTANVGRGT